MKDRWRDLSPRQLQILSALQAKPSIAERLLGSSPSRAALLRDLVEDAPLRIIPEIATFVLESDLAVASAAAEVIDAAVQHAVDDDLIEFEEAWRSSWSLQHAWRSYAPDPERIQVDLWDSMAPAVVASFARFGDAEPSVVGLASFHRSGWVRQAAVARLVEAAPVAAVRFLLLRVGDWVAPVAELARAGVERALVPEHAEQLVRHLPLLLRVTARPRRETNDLRERAFAILRGEKQAAVLSDARLSPDRRTRRMAFRLSREADHADRLPLLLEALQNEDTLIRLEAMGDGRILDARALQLVASVATSDPFPLVRRDALVMAAERLGHESDALVLNALTDRSRTVRETARYHAKRRGVLDDPVTFYREYARGSSPSWRRAAAVLSIGEVGSAADAIHVEPFLADPRARVRAAAVTAVMMLDGIRWARRILPMLADPAPSVTHAVRKTSKRHSGVLGYRDLVRMLDALASRHGRRDALLLGAGLSKWESLPLMLEGAADYDESLRGLAAQSLESWFNRENKSFEQPTEEQLQTIQTVLDKRRLALQRGTEARLRFTLKGWTS